VKLDFLDEMAVAIREEVIESLLEIGKGYSVSVWALVQIAKIALQEIEDSAKRNGVWSPDSVGGS